MKKILLLTLPILMITYLSCQRKFDPQNSDWQSAYISNLDGFVSKQVGKIKYTMHSSRSVEEREEIIKEVEKSIGECLEIVGEDEFSDSLHIALIHNLDEMGKYFGYPFAGLAGLRDNQLIEELPEYKNEPFVGENSIRSLYILGNKYNPLKHEVMHIVMFTKWGYEAFEPQWLVEGVPTFANPEYYSCDGLTIEERYAYLLQNDKLLEIDKLIRFPNEEDKAFISDKAAYCQSAYLVEYLVQNYGIDNIKRLWIDGSKEIIKAQQIASKAVQDLDSESKDTKEALEILNSCKLTTFSSVFKQVYGVTFEKIIERVNSEILTKYPNRIELSWDDFVQKCMD